MNLPWESISLPNTVSKLSRSTACRTNMKKTVATVIKGISEEKKMQIANTVSICA